MISIILIEPEKSGNIGSVARVMANFDFNRLVLVNPKCDPLSFEAIKFSKHAQDIIKSAEVIKTQNLKKSLSQFHTIIATTSKLGTDYNIPRSPISPEQLAEKVSCAVRKSKKVDIAILFGRESKGLYNSEISLCDFVVTIPTSKQYPALNLSHSAGIILYELYKKFQKPSISSHIIFAGKPEKEQIKKMFAQIFNSLPFATEQKKQTQFIIWNRIIGKSFMTKRESFAVMGLLRKLLEKLK